MESLIFDSSAFCDGEVHERRVILGDDSEHIVWFRALPNTQWKRFYMWLQSDDEETRASAEARLVSIGVCNADGSQALTFEQAQMLKITVLGQLLTALRDVNGQLPKPIDEDDADPEK